MTIPHERAPLHESIASELKKADGQVVSSSQLCQRFSVSRAAIWKQIEVLRRQGYEIAAKTRVGYSLASAPDLPNAIEVGPLLATSRLGREIRYLRETESTNRVAAALAREGVAEGVVVAAGAQKAGRGRMSRGWFSPPGLNLYVSILLRPTLEPGRATSLPLVAGLAVAESLRELAPGLKPRLKWPNDILCNRRKLCGVLCEMHAENDHVGHIILGVGLNVNLPAELLPAELRASATSLYIETRRRHRRSHVLATLLNTFEPLYDQWRDQGLEPLLPLLRRYDALYGQRIELERGDRRISGVADGIMPDGALRLLTAQGTEFIYSGEAHIGTDKLSAPQSFGRGASDPLDDFW